MRQLLSILPDRSPNETSTTTATNDDTATKVTDVAGRTRAPDKNKPLKETVPEAGEKSDKPETGEQDVRCEKRTDVPVSQEIGQKAVAEETVDELRGGNAIESLWKRELPLRTNQYRGPSQTRSCKSPGYRSGSRSLRRSNYYAGRRCSRKRYERRSSFR